MVSDKSGLSELKVGTYDGGATKTRSFVRFDPAEVQGMVVSSAQLSLYETWSYSCAARALDAWSVTSEATTATRWSAQPALVTKVGSVSAAKGYSSACPAGRVGVPVTSLVQRWSGTTPVHGTPTESNVLGAGQKLLAGQSLAAPNGTYYLLMQGDGNLVVYGPAGALWSSQTQGSGAYAIMQSDGNLVVYRGSTPLWWSQTSGSGARAVMQDDGNFVIYQGSVPLWYTGGAPATPPGTIALVAGNESDSHGWKRFASSETADDPVLEYTYNHPPATPAGLTVTPTGADASAPVHTPTLTPTLSATVADLDGAASLNASFQVMEGSTVVWQGQHGGVPTGAVASVQVPAGVLSEGKTYSFRVSAWDGSLASRWSTPVTFVADVTRPGAPHVFGSPYLNDGAWHGGAGQAGTFTFTPATNGGSVASYRWGISQAPSTTVAADGAGAAAISWTPQADGPHTVRVVAVDRAGNTSTEASYPIRVGQAGLISPTEGGQVVRRVRLAVAGAPSLTHVRFLYRRGAGSPAQPVPLPHLSLPDGTAVSSPWVRVSDLAGSCPDAGGQYTQVMADFCAQTGGYARWDAGLTLGSAAGPVQVQAQFATDAAGGGAVPTNRWTTITVDPDADGAASSEIGPASVNLLTGDGTLTGEDAAEFGVSVGRVASSRDPAAGYRPQGELLSANQQGIGTDTAGFTTTHATLTRETALGHSGTDSFKVTGKGSDADTYTTLGPSDTGVAPYLVAGRRYRVSGWVYVPAATGLDPAQQDRGLRLVAVTGTGNGQDTVTVSPKPAVTDAWVQLSMDVQVPAGATTAQIRLYNGNTAASGRAVYFDDLSVRQLWAPFGPQWSLSVDDESSETAYDSITAPDPDVRLVHFSGGGQIGFLSTGTGGWFPEPGAEGLVLTQTPPGGAWLISTAPSPTSPPTPGAPAGRCPPPPRRSRMGRPATSTPPSRGSCGRRGSSRPSNPGWMPGPPTPAPAPPPPRPRGVRSWNWSTPP